LYALVCLFFAIIFQPLITQGDSLAYIKYALQIFGIENINYDFSYKSPFYSIVLGIFHLIFGAGFYLKTIIVLQYLLIFFSALLITNIFNKLIANKIIVGLIGLFFIINFSTITFGYTILSETLTLFLFIYIASRLISLDYNETAYKRLIFIGILVGLLILTRFNLLVLPLFILVIILLLHFSGYGIKKWQLVFKNIAAFIFPVLIILNFWCIRNFVYSGSYYLFPSQYASQRFIAPPMLEESTIISAKYQDLKDIFLKAKKKLLQNETEVREGSFLNFIGDKKMMYRYNYGYGIYRAVVPELVEYYNLKDNENLEIKLAGYLSPFFDEITSQNKMEVLKFRIFSLLNTLRPSIVTTPDSNKINISKLPQWIKYGYKIFFLILMITFGIFTLIKIISMFKRKTSLKEVYLIILLIMISYFPVVNFLAITIGDANRFKFPSEPLIIGLTTYYIFSRFSKNMSRKKTE